MLFHRIFYYTLFDWRFFSLSRSRSFHADYMKQSMRAFLLWAVLANVKRWMSKICWLIVTRVKCRIFSSNDFSLIEIFNIFSVTNSRYFFQFNAENADFSFWAFYNKTSYNGSIERHSIHFNGTHYTQEAGAIHSVLYGDTGFKTQYTLYTVHCELIHTCASVYSFFVVVSFSVCQTTNENVIVDVNLRICWWSSCFIKANTVLVVNCCENCAHVRNKHCEKRRTHHFNINILSLNQPERPATEYWKQHKTLSSCTVRISNDNYRSKHVLKCRIVHFRLYVCCLWHFYFYFFFVYRSILIR